MIVSLLILGAVELILVFVSIFALAYIGTFEHKKIPFGIREWLTVPVSWLVFLALVLFAIRNSPVPSCEIGGLVLEASVAVLAGIAGSLLGWCTARRIIKREKLGGHH